MIGQVSPRIMADNPVILITRPEPQASRFADEIRNEIGNRAEILVHPLSIRKTLNVQMHSDDFEGVAFTSESAVLSASELWTGPKGKAYAVGDRTAECAKKNGWQVESAKGTAQDLALLIASDPKAKRILWPRGEVATSGFVEKCSRLGVQIIDWPVYKMVPKISFPDGLDATSGQIVLLVFSTESAKTARSVFGHLAEHISVVVISSSAAKIFESFKNIYVADAPNGGAMIAKVLAIFPSPIS